MDDKDRVWSSATEMIKQYYSGDKCWLWYGRPLSAGDHLQQLSQQVNALERAIQELRRMIDRLTDCE